MDGNAEKEKGLERIPTREEVLGIIARFAEGAAVVHELSDEQGLYLLEARVEGSEPRKAVQYEYIRKGVFPNQNRSSATVISAVSYEGTEVVYAENVAELDAETGQWA